MKKDELTEFVGKLDDLPQKEKNIYAAVGRFIKEGRDISTLTISEISVYAGIGKGTTYEYFQSKEELLSKAIFYLMVYAAKDILLILSDEGDFKEKFYRMLDIMWLYKVDDSAVQAVIRLVKNMRNTPSSKSNLLHFGFDGDCSEMKMVEGILMDFVGQGIEEKIFTETDPVYQKNIFYSQFVLYILLMQETADESKIAEIKDFIYKGLVDLLNLRKA